MIDKAQAMHNRAYEDDFAIVDALVEESRNKYQSEKNPNINECMLQLAEKLTQQAMGEEIVEDYA
jgi:hypothetical protein